MYISLYDEQQRHITNVTDATRELTQRVYDPDTFTGEGVCDVDVNSAKIAVVCDDAGNYQYACFADEVTPETNIRRVKGRDFKTLWDTEILLDYTAEGSFDGRLSAIFEKVRAELFDGEDVAVKKIPVEVVIPEDGTDTTEVFGSYQGTYQLVNAYAFLKGYLKYYEYNIESRYDMAAGKIVFNFVKCDKTVQINLKDFIYELTTSSSTTNKAVATIKYDVETPETDEAGSVVYTDVPMKDGTGKQLYAAGGAEAMTPRYMPRPADLATRYYYLTSENDIVQSNAKGDIPGRIYPVRAKWFEAEYLADAQYNAVSELANARYVDNIILENNAVVDPIDFSDYPLYTKVQLFYDGVLYKTLPISEKIFTLNGGGETVQIKLGFKKILLTEIIKG